MSKHARGNVKDRVGNTVRSNIFVKPHKFQTKVKKATSKNALHVEIVKLHIDKHQPQTPNIIYCTDEVMIDYYFQSAGNSR